MGSIVEMTENSMAKLEDRLVKKFTPSVQQRENGLKKKKTTTIKQNFKALWDNNKRPNISISIPEVGEKIWG